MTSLPLELTDNEVNDLECHFNWNIGDVISAQTLKERIEAVKGHIREKAANVLPQSYCLLAYLKSKEKNLYPEVLSDLLEAQKSCSSSTANSWQFGLGFKAVVLANMTVWQYKNMEHADAKRNYKEYNNLKSKYAKS